MFRGKLLASAMLLLKRQLLPKVQGLVSPWYLEDGGAGVSRREKRIKKDFLGLQSILSVT